MSLEHGEAFMRLVAEVDADRLHSVGSSWSRRSRLIRDKVRPVGPWLGLSRHASPSPSCFSDCVGQAWAALMKRNWRRVASCW